MVEIEHTITIKTKNHVLDLTMDEAIDLKDALIKAIGAQARPEKKKAESGMVYVTHESGLISRFVNPDIKAVVYPEQVKAIEALLGQGKVDAIALDTEDNVVWRAARSV